ncbi:helix-turn-helix domain-containing protein [Candidatus Galacturonibacter soehngenii]|uniref:helix-turn-helix domain-containing protein n=1 Tax=Candidatus Galacturonatibacter soehngenii TaxID=2307010 RepID=UPI00177E8920|nr:helix-turn-helix domain-containing protein [Candidatus Galacturonibacter soehngenii]
MNYQNAVLIQAQKMVDKQLQSLQLFTMDMSNDTTITNFLEGDNLSASELNFQIWEISQHMKGYNAPYKNLLESMVYSVKYDYLISADWADSGVSKKIQRLETEELNQLLQQFLQEQRQYGQYQVLEDSAGTRELLMLHTIPLWSTGKDATGTICLRINKKALLSNVEEMEELKKGLLCLLDKNGEPIASTGTKELLNALPQALEIKSGFLDIADDSYTVSTIPSELNGWTYISIQPEHALLNKLQTTRNISLLMMVIVLLIGVASAVLLSRKNYKPLEKLLQSLREQSLLQKERVDADENEFSLIERSVADMTWSMSVVRETLHEELPLIRENLLMQLLKNAVVDYERFKVTLENMGIVLPFRKFCVAVVRLVTQETDQLEELALFQVILKEQFSHLIPKEIMHATVIPHSKLVVLIMNSEIEELENQVEKVMFELCDVMISDYSYMIAIYVSRTVTGIDQVPYAYHNALHACSIQSQGGVVMLRNEQTTARPVQSLDEISAPLQNYIATGNEEEALTLLRQHYQINFGQGSHPLHIVRGYFIGLLNIILGICPAEEQEKILIENNNPLELIFVHDTSHQMEITVETVTSHVCRVILNSKKSHASFLTDQILEFIEQEFSNNDLTLSYVADHFYITASYLSAFFKENVGDTFLNYLTRLRIEKSKELIRNTNLTMAEIAEKVGYASGNTFTRIFKKVEHITPTQYRESSL